MNVNSAVPVAAVPFLPPGEHPLLLKREGARLPPLIKPGQAKSDCYPSPPMSNPPSPPQSHEPQSVLRPGPVTSSAPVGVASPTAPSAARGDSASLQSSVPSFPAGPPYPVASHESVARAGQSSGTRGFAVESSAVHTGRKTKAHVASACVNCKRAHLSCDVQRPCARCVASGKEDTCFDVAHKKRGRPRLREEGDSKTGTVMTPAVAQASVSAYPTIETAQGSARPIARARHRRAESFRSFHSHASDDAQPPAPGPFYGSIAPQSYPGPPPRHEVATAFLDLDLIVIKANRPFGEIMMAGQDIRGRHLSDFAAPADTEGFNAIRNRLRAEREARDPFYMPPIVRHGQDLVPEITEVGADHAARGYSDQTYSWTQTRLGAAAQTFPARVRLARGSMYFVVVTLPSFEPVEAARPIGPSPFATAPTSYPSEPREQQQREVPRSHFPPALHVPPRVAQTQADRRLSFPTFPTAAPLTTTRPTSMLFERAPERRPFLPRPSVEQPASRPENMQLPSITSRMPMTSPGESRTSATTASDTPAKRRRLGIDDVLQR